jgi:hypothetical protein
MVQLLDSDIKTREVLDWKAPLLLRSTLALQLACLKLARSMLNCGHSHGHTLVCWAASS